ncbi:hypothetical protein PENTCL1PPCAC_2110, partial [Pristionchus entomophagus]
ILLYLSSTTEARRCFPEEKMTSFAETNCPPDWYCYILKVNKGSKVTMGCTKYPWRIPMAVRNIIFIDDKNEGKSIKLKAILSPQSFALSSDDDAETYKYCATREVFCDWSFSTLYDYEYSELLAYFDWFEGAKHYAHYHSDRLAEIADITGETISWYHFNVLFGLF